MVRVQVNDKKWKLKSKRYQFVPHVCLFFSIPQNLRSTDGLLSILATKNIPDESPSCTDLPLTSALW